MQVSNDQLLNVMIEFNYNFKYMIKDLKEIQPIAKINDQISLWNRVQNNLAVSHLFQETFEAKIQKTCDFLIRSHTIYKKNK